MTKQTNNYRTYDSFASAKPLAISLECAGNTRPFLIDPERIDDSLAECKQAFAKMLVAGGFVEGQVDELVAQTKMVCIEILGEEDYYDLCRNLENVGFGETLQKKKGS